MHEQQDDVLSPLTVFYSYAHEDEVLQKELEKHLSSLRRQGIITTWHDREIVPGTDWADVIDAHLETASVILLLVSPDFIYSDYCYGIEMQRALERHHAGDAIIIPILLRPVDVQGAPFAHLQCLPFDTKPVTKWANRDEAFLDIVRGIRVAIERLRPLSQEDHRPPLLSNTETALSCGEGATTSLAPTPPHVINAREAIDLFHCLMFSGGQMRVLRLLGDALMGKSHLLTKIFPPLAQQMYQTQSVILDFDSHHETQTVPYFLHSACRQLGIQENSHYHTAYRGLMNQTKKGKLEQLLILLSQPPMSAQDWGSELYKKDFDLTMWFIEDLNELSDRPLLFLFDTIDSATTYIQTWLMDTLLEHLSSLDHVRVVVAGRSLPKAFSSYASYCQSYHLSPVTEVEAYIAYCRHARLTLPESSIRDFAHAFRYVPGLFAEFVNPNFAPQRGPND
jgi:hypothetical protein